MRNAEKGDVVRLRSGGPNMTLAKIPRPADRSLVDEYECLWFNVHGSLDSARIDGDLLIMVQKAKPPEHLLAEEVRDAV